jgi:hypothetical protein
MITINTPDPFIPWPEDMPDGYAYVGTPQSAAQVQPTIDIWRSMPANLTTALNKPLQTPRSNGANGKPFLIAGPNSIIESVVDLESASASGLYRNVKGTWIFNSTVFAHEWGHFLDFEYKARSGASQSNLRDTAGLTDLISAIVSSLPDGLYAKTNTTEWFAEFFAGWITRNRRFQAVVTEPRALTTDNLDYNGASLTAVRTYFSTLLPFTGMDLYQPYSGIQDADFVRANRGGTYDLYILPLGNPTPSSIRWESSTNGGTPTTQVGMTGTSYTMTFPTDTAITQVTYIAYATNSVGETAISVYNILPMIGTSAPTIYIGTPTVASAVAGSTIVLKATAYASVDPTVYWQKADSSSGVFTTIPGETSTTLSVVVPSGQTDLYRAVFSNPTGTTFGKTCEVREPTTVLGAVTGLRNGLATESSLTVYWSVKYGASSYKVEYKLSSSSTWLVFAGAQTAAQSTIPGLTASSSYDVRVSGNNALGTGAASTILTTSTTAAASGTRVVDGTGVSAAAAYGLRKLRSVYAGPAIRIRRISDSAEIDIPFSGNEVDSSVYESFITANDQLGEIPVVVTWYDQSANAVHLSQANQLYQPQLINTGGRLAVRFDYAINTGYLYRASFGLYAAGATTMAIVLKSISDQGTIYPGYVVNETTSTVNNATKTYDMMSINDPTFSGVAGWRVRASNNTPTTLYSNILGDVTADAQHVGTYTDSGTKINTYIDGIQNHNNFTATRTGTLTPDRFTIGGLANAASPTQCFNGTVSEVILWKSVLTTTQRQSVESDQKTYYNTP